MKVSVSMITYNHEKFIAQAIDSVLMQQTDFDYELVIGEDCSTDRTREIVISYQEKYPNRIRTLLHTRNLGPPHSPGKNNGVSTLKACRGEYIALLEGDDYWTDPLKLQKQVDILDKKGDIIICFHNTEIIYEDKKSKWGLSNYEQKKITTIEDIIGRGHIGWYIMTGSIMFRNFVIDSFPNWFFDVLMGDYPLQLMLAAKGDIYYIDRVMGVYRRHAGGLSQSSPEVIKENVIKIYQNINQYTFFKYNKLINSRIREEGKEIVYIYKKKCRSNDNRTLFDYITVFFVWLSHIRLISSVDLKFILRNIISIMIMIPRYVIHNLVNRK